MKYPVLGGSPNSPRPLTNFCGSSEMSLAAPVLHAALLARQVTSSIRLIRAASLRGGRDLSSPHRGRTAWTKGAGNLHGSSPPPSPHCRSAPTFVERPLNKAKALTQRPEHLWSSFFFAELRTHRKAGLSVDLGKTRVLDVGSRSARRSRRVCFSVNLSTNFFMFPGRFTT